MQWTLTEYYRAAELGVFAPDERLELIEGKIFKKAQPRSTHHTVAIYQKSRKAP